MSRVAIRSHVNYYCRGLGHVSDGMIRSARMVDELKGRIGDRYHKVDLEAYSRHKTIEFQREQGGNIRQEFYAPETLCLVGNLDDSCA